MDRINFDKGNKKVQVDEDGSYIIIPMGDNSFPERMIVFSEEAESNYKLLYEKEVEFKELAKGKELENSGIEELSKMRSEIFTSIGKAFDKLLGEGSCMKVFGNIAPSQDIMIDFMEQIEPLVKKYAIERQSEIEEKYNKRGRR